MAMAMMAHGAAAASVARTTKMSKSSSRRTVKLAAGSSGRVGVSSVQHQHGSVAQRAMVQRNTRAQEAKMDVTSSKRMSRSVVLHAKQDFNIDTEEIVGTLKEKWDGVEDKSQALLYAGGALLGLYVVNAIVGAVNSLPVIPKLMELVGLGYTVWFTYRYLIFKSSRVELKKEIEDLKTKISGIGGD